MIIDDFNDERMFILGLKLAGCKSHPKDGPRKALSKLTVDFVPSLPIPISLRKIVVVIDCTHLKQIKKTFFRRFGMKTMHYDHRSEKNTEEMEWIRAGYRRATTN